MKKNIVVLGAGFGGLRAAMQLDKKLKKLQLTEDYQVILVDRNNFHTFPPLLYEIAATSKETADYCEMKSLVTYPLLDLIRNTAIKFVQDEILHIDLPEDSVHLKNSKLLKFDYLILALGAETNYFDITGIKENSFTLKSFNDAIKIRDAIWTSFGDRKDLPADVKDLEIIIGGGGSTGVELASEIKEWACELQDENNLKCKIQVTIIEGGENVLPGFDQRVIEKVVGRLNELGVRVMNNERILKVIDKAVVLANGKVMPFDILIWTGGIKGMTLAKKMPLKLDKRNRIEVMNSVECVPDKPSLQSKISSRIYAIGDIACFSDSKTGNPVPQVARAAIEQANVAAKNIIEDIMKTGRNHIYRPWTYPYIIPVGGKFAVAKVGPFIISGLGGWILKGLVELNYLISIMPIWTALKIWLRGLKVFIRNDRLG